MEDSRGGGDRRRRKEVCEIEDLQEKEAWAMIKAREGSSSNLKTRNKLEHGPPSSSSLSSSAWNIKAATTDRGAACHHSSSPLDIPGWSKIFKKKSKKKLWDDDACDGLNDGDKVERDEDKKMGRPPHEYLARRLETTQMASHSMCEGVGRTLKGRDLSKLRDAILTKTGFIE